MSVEDLHAFFGKLEGDEGLRRQAMALDALPTGERFAALRALATQEGFDVTEEDWRHESVGPAVAALEDEELRGVVGGDACAPWAYLGSGGVGAAGGSCGQSGGAYGSAGGRECG
jgi:predicted ribosomally synthesized peptide with nif11-like leader